MNSRTGRSNPTELLSSSATDTYRSNPEDLLKPLSFWKFAGPWSLPPRSQELLVFASAKLFPAQPLASSREPAHQPPLDLTTALALWASYARPSRCLPPFCLPKTALLEDQIIQPSPDHLHSSFASSVRTLGDCRQPWRSASVPSTRASYSQPTTREDYPQGRATCSRATQLCPRNRVLSNLSGTGQPLRLL